MITQLSAKTHATLLASLIALCLAGCQQARINADETAHAALEFDSARSAELASVANDQYQSGNFQGCRRCVAEALKLTPDNANLHFLSAKLAIEGGQLEIAGRELTLARRLAPNDSQADYLTGVIYQRQQQPETAYEFYQRAANRSPAEPAYVLAESKMLAAMGRDSEAMNLLQSRVASFDRSAAIRDSLGQMLMQARKYPQAAAMFRQANALCENDPGIRQRLALALYATGEYRDCAASLAALVENKPFADRADLLVMLGYALEKLGRPAEAATFCKRALEMKPGDEMASRLMASVDLNP